MDEECICSTAYFSYSFLTLVFLFLHNCGLFVIIDTVCAKKVQNAENRGLILVYDNVRAGCKALMMVCKVACTVVQLGFQMIMLPQAKKCLEQHFKERMDKKMKNRVFNIEKAPDLESDSDEEIDSHELVTRPEGDEDTLELPESLRKRHQ